MDNALTLTEATEIAKTIIERWESRWQGVGGSLMSRERNELIVAIAESLVLASEGKASEYTC